MGQEVYELLAQIQARPAMWLGTAKISLLEAYLNGFYYAQSSARGQSGNWPPLGLLPDWMANKFNPGSAVSGWSRILTQHCKGDEQAALHLFFDVLEEFKEVRIMRVLEFHLSPAAHAFYASDACLIQRYTNTDPARLPAPANVYVVQFSGDLGHYIFHHRSGQPLSSDGSYPSFRACLKRLRQEFGGALAWQEVGSLSVAALTTLL
jgi:hypothetical protein